MEGSATTKNGGLKTVQWLHVDRSNGCKSETLRLSENLTNDVMFLPHEKRVE